MVPLSPSDVLSGKIDDKSVAEAVVRSLDRSRRVAIYLERSSGGAAAGAVDTGERLSSRLASVAARVLDSTEVNRLVVAGGETSGAVCSACGFDAFAVGQQLSPGVPLCFPLGGSQQVVVLKSGNFGSVDLYGRVGGEE